MFPLTAALKRFAVENSWVGADASEKEFRRAIALKLTQGKISTAKLRELIAQKDAPTTQPRQPAPTPRRSTQPGRRPAPSTTPRQTQPAVMTQEELDATIQKSVDAAISRKEASSGGQKAITPEVVLTKSEPIRARVKMAMERYNTSHKDAFYPARTGYRGEGNAHLLAGQRAKHGTTELCHPSELDKAVAGSYFKWCLKSTCPADQLPGWARMTDHDTDLINYAIRSMEWTGVVGTKSMADEGVPVNRRKLTDFEVKALLDDSTSGGIEATPYVFDDAIVLTPVLYGELFPLVNTINVARGRRMKGAAMSNPTFTSGVAEGTAITPFDTTAFVSAFDTTIFPAVAAMEIGLDFEEDSPVDLGKQIVEQYGLKALEWLDRVVAVGDGTTEPQGIFNASGTTTISSANGPGGALTVSDFEGLMFGVTKQFRNEAGSNPVYVANDTMYRRAVGINVGPGDERRVFGMDHGDYTLFKKPFKVQNNIGNGYLAYVNLKRYRMYRRLGMAVRYENTGRTLALSNSRLIVLRMRYGGKLELGGAMAKIIDGVNN